MPQAKRVQWIDIQLPPNSNVTAPELKEIQKRTKVHPVVLKELTNPSSRSRVENYGDYLFVIYQFPTYSKDAQMSRHNEIDFIITKHEVITVRYDKLDAITSFESRLENEVGFQETATKSSLQFTYHLLEHLLGFNQRELRHIQENVEEIGEELFANRERELLEVIAYLKRDISEYRIIFSPIGQLLVNLQQAGTKFWGNESIPYLNDLHHDFLELMGRLEDYRSAILDFESTNTQLVNSKTNQVMERFTIMAFITFPIMTFISLFSVRLSGVPLTEHPHGFWGLVGVVVLLLIGMLTYFRLKKWL